jgi:CHASE2 domain-containing sensor protein
MPIQGSLIDLDLVELFNKLSPDRPRLIASDIYHDFAFIPQLDRSIQANKNFIAVCQIDWGEPENQPIASPPSLLKNRLGFTNFPEDLDRKIRRQFLGMSPDETCPTDRSLSLRVALAYLQQEKHKIAESNSLDPYRIGQTKFPKLTANLGAYQLSADAAKGYQIIINYRVANFETISLQELLENPINPTKVSEGCRKYYDRCPRYHFF